MRSRWGGLALAGLVAAAVAIRVVLADGMEAPVVLCDEFIYANLAKSIAEHGDYLVRGVPQHQSLLYPLLLAPAWFWHSMTTTYFLAKTVGAVAMSLVAVPVYLWGRRLVAPGHAVVAAGLTLLLPAFFYSGILMTESVFLPAFVLAAFAIALALERPTLLHQLGALVAVALAMSVRVQGIALVLVIPTAALMKAGLDAQAGVPGERVWLALRRLWPTAAILGGGLVVYVLFKTLTQSSLTSGLGPYESLATMHYRLPATAHWTVRHLAELGLAVGLLPMSALIVLLWLALRGVPTTAAERAFLAVVPAAMLWVLVEAGAFASAVTPFVFERYTFYLEPLLLLAFTLWLGRGLPRPAVGTAVSLAVPVLLLLSIRLADVVVPDFVNGVTMASLYHFSLHLPGRIHELKAAISAAVVLAAFLFAICARPMARVALPLLLGLYLGVASSSAVTDVRRSSRGARAAAGPDPSWVVRAVGRDAGVVYVNTPELGWASSAELLQTEFWNPNIDGVYSVGATELCGLPETPTSLDASSGRIAPPLPARVRYAVVDRLVPFSGTLVATGGSGDRPLALYRIRGPVRLGSATDGVYGDGWMGESASYTVFASSGRSAGRLTVVLGRTGWAGSDVPGNVRIAVGRPRAAGAGLAKVLDVRHWVVHRLAQRSFVFDVRPPVRVDVRVTPTFSPSQFGLTDTRQLGAQVSFSFEPRR